MGGPSFSRQASRTSGKSARQVGMAPRRKLKLNDRAISQKRVFHDFTSDCLDPLPVLGSGMTHAV